MSAIDGVSETFDAEAWDIVPGFEDLTDLTYHRARAHGTVRIAFDRPDVLNAFRPHTVDELATGLGMDPIELRARNEPDVEPEGGAPYSSRHYVECFREGAARFGWAERDPRPRQRREGEWWVGTGVAGATNAEYVPYHVTSSRTTLHTIHHDTAHPSALLLPVVPLTGQEQAQ